ncbi:MAG: hypothetical protein QNJ42_19375 [Crocosphaera sp.]|nr:hypothetical protein [Crocosphaera sp.]
MTNLRFTQSIILLTVMVVSSGIGSNANAQANQQDEIRYVQEAVKVMYEQNRNRSFTVQELLEDGYAMCQRIANSDPLENLAEDLIRSGLGVGGSRPQDDPEMMRVAQRYLCNN